MDIQYRAELDRDPDVDKVKVVTQCYSTIEASSNVADIYKMTNGDTASFWQSDGSARSHWIRHVTEILQLIVDLNYVINFRVESNFLSVSQIENETGCGSEASGHCCGLQ